MYGANRPVARANPIHWLAAALLGALALAGCSSAPRDFGAAPAAGGVALQAESRQREEVDAHRLGDDPFIHARDDTKDTLFESVSVTVFTDAEGRVAEAKVIGGPAAYYAAAEQAVRGTRYRPFLQDGRPVPAVFVDYVQILPRERPPAHRVPMPAGDPAGAVVTMKRTPCYGTCPAYEVTLEGSGRVTWRGQDHVAVAAPVTYQVAAADVARLVGLFAQADFFSLDKSYRAGMTDGPTTTLTLSIGGKTKSVEDYIGYAVGMPISVERLEKAIDETAKTGPWIKGGAETVPALRRAGFAFESPAAAQMLACGVQRLPESLIQDLLDAGVNPNGTCDGVSALALAGEAGRRASVKALIAAGADVTGKDPGGQTIAQVAAARKWQDVTQMIEKRL